MAMKISKQVIAILTKDIVRVSDPTHPFYDPRAKRALDVHQLADYRDRGQIDPVHVVSLANAEALGASFEGGTHVLIDGNGRHIGCTETGIEYMTAFVHEFDSLSDFKTFKLRQNSMRDEETFPEQVEKARAIAEAAKAEGKSEAEIVASIMISTRKGENTVRDFLKFLDPSKTGPELKQAIDSGQIDYGSAKQAATLPLEKQPVLLDNVNEIKSDLLTKALETGKVAEAAAEPGKEKRLKTAKGSGTVSVDKKGDVQVTVSQDTVMEQKAKVAEAPVPPSVKRAGTPKKAPVSAIDSVLVNGHRTRISMMRSLPAPEGVDYADFIVGAEMLAALVTGAEYTLRDDASETAKAAYAHLFKKAE